MTAPRSSAHGLLVALALVALLVGVPGCYNPFSPRIAPVLGFSKPAPVPNSAPNLLRLFEWCNNNQAIAEYRELFADDYRFYFSPLDTTGKQYSGTPWTREDELISTTHLFVGGSATQPPASRITMTLDNNFYVFPDPTQLKWDPQGRWHKSIRTQIHVLLVTDNGNAQEVTGAVNFYLVRGDSALIPQELRDRGFAPDQNRWYIRRLDDETAHPEDIGAGQAVGTLRSASVPPADQDAARAPSPLAFGDPPIPVSWGYIKAYYRGPRALAARSALAPSPAR